MNFRLIACAVVSAALAGCSSPPKGFDSPEPAERLRAISRAAREKDSTAIPRLIESLNGDDPAVRLAAIRTLELLTGQTLGYDYAAPEWRREEMIRAWTEWYKLHNPPKASPAIGNRGSAPGRRRAGGADTVC